MTKIGFYVIVKKPVNSPVILTPQARPPQKGVTTWGCYFQAGATLSGIQIPSPNRVMAFVDGQNLFHSVKEAFGYAWPNYDPLKLSRNVVEAHVPNGCLEQVRFYTGVPTVQQNPKWNHFWSEKLFHFRSQGIEVHKGRISDHSRMEKGVDVKLAIDLVALAYEQNYDTAVIFSCDTDFAPAVSLARTVGRRQDRYISFISCYLDQPGEPYRGLPYTRQICISKDFYDACLDQKRYRSLLT